MTGVVTGVDPGTSGDRRKVVVVTGGGRGIGAAIAEDLGRAGTFVVTMDPLVTIDGSEQLPAPQVVAGIDATISVPALGLDLPLADIYAGIEFD